MSRRRKTRRSLPLIPILAAVLIVLCTALLSMGFHALTHRAPSRTGETIATTQAAVQTQAQPEVVATATLASFGDLLMHRPIIEACLMDSGEYDFSTLFRYITQEIHSYDYVVANLETSLGGPDCGIRYQGNPLFNCPDAIVDAARNAGIQMLLTANNHCADTGIDGVLRTLDVIGEKGLQALGTRPDTQSPKHALVEVNGIRIGMLCYTYATSAGGDGAPGFNLKEPVSQPGLINYYLNTDLPGFYTELRSAVQELEQAGAEVLVAYIHWGDEYMLQENQTQRAIAQELCNMGVDVIIGGHPHVVEPVDLLTSTADSAHKALCIYSLGNAVSNQRIEEMNMKSGHTEDGAVFAVTFEKYSDGQVYIRECSVLPIWVNKYSTGPRYEYNILPLDRSQSGQWAQSYGLTGEAYSNAMASWERTMALVGTGLERCSSYLAQAKLERDAPGAE